MTTPGPAPAPAPGATTPPTAGWWRRNRWALAALPVVLALTVAAAGDRVRTLWWEQGLHRPTTVAPGDTVDFHQRVYAGAAGGTAAVDVRVGLDAVRDVRDVPEDLELPPGTRAVQVDLTLAADPDVVLVGCHLAVRDADGTRYDYAGGIAGGGQPVVPCVPEDATGPWPSLGEKLDEELSDPTGEAIPRPATWTVSPLVVVPEDVEVVDVVLWWQMPQHLRLEVAR